MEEIGCIPGRILLETGSGSRRWRNEKSESVERRFGGGEGAEGTEERRGKETMPI